MTMDACLRVIKPSIYNSRNSLRELLPGV